MAAASPHRAAAAAARSVLQPGSLRGRKGRAAPSLARADVGGSGNPSRRAGGTVGGGAVRRSGWDREAAAADGGSGTEGFRCRNPARFAAEAGAGDSGLPGGGTRQPHVPLSAGQTPAGSAPQWWRQPSEAGSRLAELHEAVWLT